MSGNVLVSVVEVVPASEQGGFETEASTKDGVIGVITKRNRC